MRIFPSLMTSWEKEVMRHSLDCDHTCKWPLYIFVSMFFWFQLLVHYHPKNWSKKEGWWQLVSSYWYRILSKGWNLSGYLDQFLWYDSNMYQLYVDHPLIILPQEYLNQVHRINNFFTFSKNTFRSCKNVNCAKDILLLLFIIEILLW